MFTWSEEQLAVFAAGNDAACGRLGHVAARARAGTGKTTTLAEMCRQIMAANRTLRIMTCAYNIRTGEDLVAKLAGVAGVWVARYTQIGFAFVRHAFRGGINVDKTKGRDCAIAACIESKKTYKNRSGVAVPDRGWVSRVIRLASLAKHTLPDTIEDLAALADKRGMSDIKYPALELASIAAKALDFAIADKTRVDMDDMVWMPCKYDMSPPWTFDIVVGDEGQDTDPAQLWLLQRIVKPNTGRLIFFGDDRQAIYSWKGASTDTFNRMVTDYSMEVVPLSKTFRCSKAVVAEAQLIVPDYTAAESADDGEVIHADSQDALTSTCRPGDFVLSRTRSALAETGLAIARENKPVRIVGYDVNTLLGMVDESRAGTIREFLAWLHDQADAIKKNRKDEDSESLDTIQTLIAFGKDCQSMSDVDVKIRKLLVYDDPKVDPSSYIICSTLHAAKGLEVKERDNSAYLIGESFKENYDTEEDNIRYVAITRAKNRLVWIGEPRLYRDRELSTPKPLTMKLVAPTSVTTSDPPLGGERKPIRRDYGRQLDLDLSEDS